MKTISVNFTDKRGIITNTDGIFRWAYIGSGSIAKQTARAITKKGHKITAVYSRSFAHAESFARKFGARAFHSADEMFSCGEFDAVYIATPHNSHTAYSVEAMKRGFPVLCEKPCGVSLRDFETARKTAEENGVYFAEAMWTWFNDVARTVREWTDGGKIGKIKSVEITHAFPGMLMSRSSRLLTPATAGGALLDIGIYPVAYCVNLFGEPETVKCAGTLKNGIDTGEEIILGYGDFECRLKTSLYCLREGAVIKGSEGKITMSPIYHLANRCTLKNADGRKTFRKKTDYPTEFSRAADEIRRGATKSEYVPPEKTAQVLKVLDECRRQMGLVYPFE